MGKAFQNDRNLEERDVCCNKQLWHYLPQCDIGEWSALSTSAQLTVLILGQKDTSCNELCTSGKMGTDPPKKPGCTEPIQLAEGQT